MRRSRLMALVEPITNVVVGYGVAVLVRLVSFPVFGFTVAIVHRDVDREGLHRLRAGQVPSGQPRCRPGHGKPLARAG